MSAWPGPISAITLFAEDLAETKRFYEGAFGLSVTYEDADSAVFSFGNTLIYLLKASEATDLVAPATAGGPARGCSTRSRLTMLTQCVRSWPDEAFNS